MATLSEILNEKITKGGKSKASVAAHLRVSERTIENYMAGKRQPKPEALGKLANFLDFDLNELYEQPVPKANSLNGHSKAGAESHLSYSQPIQERYISLLEQTLKEKKDELIELKARLDELAGRQTDFLSKVEGSIERYEHLVLAQLQSKGQPIPDSSPTVLQQTYKTEGSVQKKGK